MRSEYVCAKPNRKLAIGFNMPLDEDEYGPAETIPCFYVHVWSEQNGQQSDLMLMSAAPSPETAWELVLVATRLQKDALWNPMLTFKAMCRAAGFTSEPQPVADLAELEPEGAA